MTRATAKLSIFFIFCLVGLPQISETIYTPALPDIARTLKTSSTLAEWTLSIYFIGFALGVGVWGKCSDHIGRRPTMLIGLSMYVAASCACALSTSIYSLLLWRWVQAFGISVGSVITMTMMRDIFTGAERGKIFSIISMSLALVPAIGPYVGGYLVQDFHWQANFTILIVMGSLLLMYSVFKLPETRPHSYPLNPYPFSKLIKILLCDKKVMAAIFLVGGLNGMLFSYYAEAPFLFINLLNFSPIRYGQLGMGIALASVLGSLISHRLNHFVRPEKIILIGCMLNCVSCLWLVLNVYCWMGNHTSSFMILIKFLGPLLGFFVSFGITIPNVLSVALSAYQEVVGTAGSIFGLSYYIVVALVLCGMGYMHNGTFKALPFYFIILSGVMLFLCPWIFPLALAKERKLILNSSVIENRN